MKSKAYKYGRKEFRYDYENGLVEWVTKATDEERKDNEEWMKKFNKPLWDIDEDGYIKIDSVGLSKENWKHKEMRDSYLGQWCDEIEEETRCLVNDFIMFG